MSKNFSDVSAITMTDKVRQKHLDAKEETIRSDTFAKHFQSHFPKDATPKQLGHNLELNILWEGNALTCVKMFQTVKYRLCTDEQLHILYRTFNKELKLINRGSENYGACRHKTKFHRFTSTDDPD
eukprot:12015570-Ditylum_brightwellii.AAC.2